MPGEEPEKLTSQSWQAQNLPSTEQHSEVGEVHGKEGGEGPGGVCSPAPPSHPLSPSPCQVERGSVQAVPLPKGPDMFSIHLLMTGALRPRCSSADCKWMPHFPDRPLAVGLEFGRVLGWRHPGPDASWEQCVQSPCWGLWLGPHTKDLSWSPPPLGAARGGCSSRALRGQGPGAAPNRAAGSLLGQDRCSTRPPPP